MKTFFLTLWACLTLYITSSLALTHHYAQPMRIASLEDGILSSQLISDNNTISPSYQPKSGPNSRGNLPLEIRQIAAGGGIPSATLALTPYPTVSNAASYLVVGTTTTVTYKMFTQTFASTALGTWALGPTPRIGTIGLGTIQGTVGVVKSVHKKALQTPDPNT